MSTQRNHYVIIGAMMGWDEFHYAIRPDDMPDGEFEYWLDRKISPYYDSAFDPISKSKALSVICDGMNGEYVAIGQVREKSGNWSDEMQVAECGWNKETIEDEILKRLGIDIVAERISFTHFR